MSPINSKPNLRLLVSRKMLDFLDYEIFLKIPIPRIQKHWSRRTIIVPGVQGTIWMRSKNKKFKNSKSRNSILAPPLVFLLIKVQKGLIKKILRHLRLFCAPRPKDYPWINKMFIFHQKHSISSILRIS